MPKLFKRNHDNEDKCDKLHKEMNMCVGPTRKEPLTLLVLPDLDPMQRQINRIQNTVEHEMRCVRRRSWRK